MGPGSKNGVSYDTIDYNIPSGSFFADYIRGVSSKLRELGVGGVYWPGLRDGDWYSLTRRSGSGSNLNLTLTNPSGLNRLRYSWGIGTGGSTTVRLVDTATGLYADGMGRTAAGSDVGQWSASTSLNQQWLIENSGTYVRIRNLGNGLYLDGMGRSANGSAAGQYPSGTSANQQWTVLTDANNVRLRNLPRWRGTDDERRERRSVQRFHQRQPALEDRRRRMREEEHRTRNAIPPSGIRCWRLP